MENSSYRNIRHSTSWNIKRSNLQKEYYPALTDADLDFDEGSEMLMLDNIQKKLGKSIRELKLVMEKNSADRLY